MKHVPEEGFDVSIYPEFFSLNGIKKKGEGPDEANTSSSTGTGPLEVL